MALLRAANRVLESTASTGLGPYSLGGTSTNFKTLVSGIGTGNAGIFKIDDGTAVGAGTNWEIIRGTVTAGSPDQLSRDFCFSSSQGGSFINWGAGTKTVECIDPAEYFGQQWKDVRAVTAASVTPAAADNATLILYDATAAPGTVNLPAGATIWPGFTIGVKKTDASANTVTSDGNAAEKLDETATRVLTAQDQIEVYVWSGSRWEVVVFALGTMAAKNAAGLDTTLVMSGAAINEAKGADIASAATTDIGAATGNYVEITGTTTITALGTVQAGTRRIVRFTGALTLTYNATSLIVPTGANIVTAAGDSAVFESAGSGNWKCVGYMRADGKPLVGKPFNATFTSSDQTITNGGTTGNIAHSLGAQPFLAFDLVCQTNDAGYTAGQILPFWASGDGAAGGLGIAAIADATNISVRFGANGIAHLNATTGATTTLTTASWKLRIKAWV